jgi:hypothetical protein
MTTVPDVYHNTFLACPPPRVCAAHIASASLHRLLVPLRVPRTRICIAIVAFYRLSCLGPRRPRRVPRPGVGSRMQHLDGVQMDREVWGGSACVQALARRGGRRRKKNGLGSGAMEAPARRSGAEPCRTKRARRKVRGGGSWCVSRGLADAECACMWGSRALEITSHRIFPSI